MEEAGPGPVAGPLRGQFQRRHGLSEPGSPAVEVGHAQLLQPVILEIPLHGVKLRHGVGNRRAGGEDDAPAAGESRPCSGTWRTYRGLLGVRGGEASHIPHLRIEEQIFVVVRLVHEQPVNAQLFKGHHIVLAVVRLQLFQPRLQRLLRAFQLLDGEPFAAAGLHLRDALGDFLNLIFQQPLLPFLADGDFLKLAVADNDRIIIPGGDSGAKLLPVVLFKVLFGCHQNVGGGVEPQKLRGPLFGQVIGHNKEGFPAQPQPLGLHGGPHHFKGLARTHLMGQQRISAVKHMGDGIALMLPQA